MSKPCPALCKDCKYSKPEERSEWNLRCHNPVVNGKDPWALSSRIMSGSECRAERGSKWFAKCDMKGKLWEKNAKV